MSQQSKNPIIAGLLNALLPGSVHIFVDNNRGQFIKTLLGGILLIAAMFTLGNAIQNTRGYSLPQGLCTGILLLLVLVPLFLMGQRTANLRNRETDSTSQYNSKRQTMGGTDQIQLEKLQKMRDEGLISDQEYQKKKRNLSSK